MLDGVIDNHIDPPGLRPSVDPCKVLAGNFRPVAELPPTPCHVIHGSIPACLRGGAYIRNGPNPQHLPQRPHHLFDGDGMLHSLLLSDDHSATLCSRFVVTYRYELELRAGRPVLPSNFSGFHGIAGIARALVGLIKALTGQMSLAKGIGLANTSLVFFDGLLLALGEPDLPYAAHVSIENGEVSTLGRYDFNRELAWGMTAHPKKDPVTGEMFAFRYGIIPPYITYFWFDGEGNKSADIPLYSVEKSCFLHDFAITENYAIFPDNQLVINPLNMIVGLGSPLHPDPGKVPRVGILPRYAENESEMRWFDVPGFNVLHVINAWEEEEGNVVVMVAPNVVRTEHLLEKLELIRTVVEMVRIDTRTGTVVRTAMLGGKLDFGIIHPGYVGRKNRYGYLSVGDPIPKFSGVVKVDFEKAGGDCVVARREYGPGKFGGEVAFVPRGGELEDEDEGYLVSYVHDETTGESVFVVMDARSPELEIVAEVLLPGRVPYGFHGLFVTEAELRSQKRELDI